jgi:magnesium-transporting ATPase (P-type)
MGSASGGYYYVPWKTEKGAGTEKVLHMTYVFQIFVFMQIFNQMNARLLTGNFNIFEGMCKNWLFVAVSIATFIIQMAMVEVGGRVTKTYPLKMWMNGLCLCFGAGALFWGVFIKLLPVKWFQCINFNEKVMTEEEQEKSVMGKLKTGSSYKFKNKMEKDVSQAIVDKINDKLETNQ